ncbi:MAG: PRTRC system ThiF family protein [Chloroflexi bacterium]|nr:PRTRC system ThiF family protein [Chloroflexota bacterium]
MQLQPEQRYPLVGYRGRTRIMLVGCGGTGSFLALHLARLAYHVQQRQHRVVNLAFVDPDEVELQNVGRQNFGPGEVGQPKAQTLMRRFNLTFGLNIVSHMALFDGQMLHQYGYPTEDLHLVVGCVDNNAARRAIHETLVKLNGRIWWLDCGNHRAAGQVLLGNRADLTAPAISPLGYCTGLPLPTVQHPDLLAEEPPPPPGGASCAELTLLDVQSLMINQAIATYAAQYVYRMAVTHDLDIHATYVNLAGGNARSLGNCATPANSPAVGS